MGTEQTEIDALAALQPGVLDRIARDALDRFYDHDLARRTREARPSLAVMSSRSSSNR